MQILTNFCESAIIVEHFKNEVKEALAVDMEHLFFHMGNNWYGLIEFLCCCFHLLSCKKISCCFAL